MGKFIEIGVGEWSEKTVLGSSSPRLPCGRRAKSSFEVSGRSTGGKDEYPVRLKGRQRDYWMGTEIGRPGGYGFQGQVTADNGSDKNRSRI